MDIKRLKSIQQNFLKELQDASNGKKTSLPFIVDQLSFSPSVKDEEIFQALVIGGSMCKSVLVKKERGKIKIIKKGEEPQPPFVTKEDFLQFIGKRLVDDVRVLAINFAYPMTPVFENGLLDGVLQFGTKENKLIGLVGKKVGKEIKKYALRKSNKRISVSVANDTICLLLSGLTKFSWEYLAGGVVGTGLNFAFFINKHRPVNVESANFNKFVLSEETKRIEDVTSSAPGKALFEKETSGAYLYRHFNLIIKERKIDYPPINSTEELNKISLLRHPEFISGSKNTNRKMMLKPVQHDTVRASEIAGDLLKHSAQLIACQIAGIVEFKKNNMVFNMEGSLFLKGNRYKETVEQTVKQMIPQYNIKFVEIKDSGILGAAKLVC